MSEKCAVFGNRVCFVDREAGGFIDHQQFSIFEENVDPTRFGSRSLGVTGLRLQREKELYTVSGLHQVTRFGAFPVQPHGVFVKQLAHVANGETSGEKAFEFLAVLVRRDDQLLGHR
jgi:hypothetical protein